MSLGWILAWDRFYAYLHDVTSPKGLQVNLEHTGSFRIVYHGFTLRLPDFNAFGVVRRLITLFRIFLQAGRHHMLKRRRSARLKLADRFRICLQNRRRQRDLTLPRKRTLP